LCPTDHSAVQIFRRLQHFPRPADLQNDGRFHRDGKQIYLLVNRLQQPISIEVKGDGSATLLDPSTGEITPLSLPAKLSAGATRALMMVRH